MMKRIALLPVLVVASASAAVAQQPCNPIIDGTYCATQMSRRPPAATPDSKFGPMQGLGRDVMPGIEQPGTLGAITFRGGEQCIGLLRRSACN